MPLEPQTLEILFEGLEQKTDNKVLKAGKLEVAKNVEFEKGGSINKRRGYLRYRFDGTTQMGALGDSMDNQAHRVVAHGDELLVFGAGWLWAIVDKNMGIDGGRSAARRGRLSPGNLVTRVLKTAAEGDGENGL